MARRNQPLPGGGFTGPRGSTRATPGGARAQAGGQTRALLLDDDAFQRALAAAVKRMKVTSEADLLRLAIRVQNRAREFCPVDTGRLRSSIVHLPGRDQRGPYVSVGTNVTYARFVEYGTRRMPAQPYLRPALAEVVGAVKRGA